VGTRGVSPKKEPAIVEVGGCDVSTVSGGGKCAGREKWNHGNCCNPFEGIPAGEIHRHNFSSLCLVDNSSSRRFWSEHEKDHRQFLAQSVVHLYSELLLRSGRKLRQPLLRLN
jgi:hypothetical protein